MVKRAGYSLLRNPLATLFGFHYYSRLCKIAQVFERKFTNILIFDHGSIKNGCFADSTRKTPIFLDFLELRLCVVAIASAAVAALPLTPAVAALPLTHAVAAASGSCAEDRLVCIGVQVLWLVGLAGLGI